MLSLLFIAVGFSMQSCSDDDDDDNSSVQTEYVNALKALYPDATNVKWEINKGYRVAEFTKKFVSYDVWFDQKATLAMTELDYGRDLFLVPDNAVTTAWSTGDYATWTLDEIKHYKQLSNEFYVFEVEKAGQPDMDLYYDVNGTLLKSIASESAPEIYPDTAI